MTAVMSVDFKHDEGDGITRVRTYSATRRFGFWWSRWGWHVVVSRSAQTIVRRWEDAAGWEGEPFGTSGEKLTGTATVQMKDGTELEVGLDGMTFDDVVETVERVSDERDRA